MQTTLAFFAIFGIYILIYNLSIYLPTILNGVRVEKFYVWYDTWFSLFKIKIKETEFGIGWLPLGGYVKISGMLLEENEEVLPYYFKKLSLIKQFFISIIGPFSSLVIFLGALIYFADTSISNLSKILIFLASISLIYFLILKLGSIISNKQPGKTFKHIIVYSFLLILQISILYIFSILVNEVFPLYHYLNEIFIEKNRVHLFFQDFKFVDFKTIVYSLGIFSFFFNLLPIGANTGSHAINILYRSLTGENVSDKFIQYTALISLPIFLFLHAYLAYILLI